MLRGPWGSYQRITPSDTMALGQVQGNQQSQVNPDSDDHPGMFFFSDSRPPGYKIWVGDLRPETTQAGLDQRIRNTLVRHDIQHIAKYILKVSITPGRAASGAAYCVITVADMQSAQVPGHSNSWFGHPWS